MMKCPRTMCYRGLYARGSMNFG